MLGISEHYYDVFAEDTLKIRYETQLGAQTNNKKIN